MTTTVFPYSLKAKIALPTNDLGGPDGMPRTELVIYADDIIYVLELRKAGYPLRRVHAVFLAADDPGPLDKPHPELFPG
jgi:hypothetical protein